MYKNVLFKFDELVEKLQFRRIPELDQNLSSLGNVIVLTSREFADRNWIETRTRRPQKVLRRASQISKSIVEF